MVSNCSQEDILRELSVISQKANALQEKLLDNKGGKNEQVMTFEDESFDTEEEQIMFSRH